MCPYQTREERESDYARRRVQAEETARHHTIVSQWRDEAKFFESSILHFVNENSKNKIYELRAVADKRLTKLVADKQLVEIYFQTMSDILKYHSRLTINFDFRVFVANYSERSCYLKNAFNFIIRPQDKTFDGYHTVDPQKRPFGYLQWRDTAERSLFQLVKQERAYLDTHEYQPVFPSAILENPNFYPATRPIYGSLDFTKALHGGAPIYGKSFIVLRPMYKKLSTFTPSDSIYLAQQPQSITSFEYLENLIGLLEPDHFLLKGKLFSTLFEMARYRILGGMIPQSVCGSYDYIEAQIHAKDLEYSQCIAEIHIDKKLFEDMTKKPNFFTTESNQQMLVKTHKVINDMQDFCRCNGIEFYFV